MIERRIIPGNPARRAQAAKEDKLRELREGRASTSGMGQPMTWAGFAKGATFPTKCDKCGRGKAWMRAIEMGDAECAYLECPHRKAMTATGAGYYDGKA